MRKYLCTTCDVGFKQHKKLNIFQAIWHKLKGHAVTRAWEGWEHVPEKTEARTQHMEDKIGSGEQRVNRETVVLFDRPIVVRRPGSQATRQDIGKFMKHGRQSKPYRRSIKAKVNPEEVMRELEEEND
jgi:hypothetical protein